MNLSICIIAKNEEKNIERCLKCLQGYGFEINVVDTGSTDSTREIASQYASSVYDFEWCNDFAAAKNFAISKATKEFVMVIDSDEYLESIDLARLQQLIEKSPEKVGRIQRRNIFTRSNRQQENVEWINRIFSKEKFHYEGRIHEQVTALDGQEYETYQAPVMILHSGYDLTEEERKAKAERNSILLLQELKQLKYDADTNPQSAEQIPYIIYQLGKSYYMAGDYAKACEYFSEGLSFDLEPKLEYVIDMVETYGYALINSGRAADALFFENIYEEFGDCADFKFLMGLIYMNNERFDEAVAEFLKATEYKECRNTGANSYLAFYNVGVIYECCGMIDEAKEFYKKSGEYGPAVDRMQEIG
ncbi:MAG: glycosyltransferase [Lachnospiraceae bacterium]|nr:glycosyltransferase [Lachnospiraceae bacterium]